MFECICALQGKTCSLKLDAMQNLDDFVNDLQDMNTLLNKAQPPQGYMELQLVNMALHQLISSFYGDQIKLIVDSYHGDLSAITSLDFLVTTLHNCDIFDGKDFGGAPTHPLG